jgi:hypothetical protein
MHLPVVAEHTKGEQQGFPPVQVAFRAWHDAVAIALGASIEVTIGTITAAAAAPIATFLSNCLRDSTVKSTLPIEPVFNKCWRSS